MTSTPVSIAESPKVHAVTLDRLAATVVLAGIADMLFSDVWTEAYSGHPPGLSVALFQVCLVAGALAANRRWPGRERMLASLAVLLAALAPVVEDFSFLAFIFAAFGTALSAGALTQPEHLAVADRLFMTGRALLAGPFRLVPDLIRARGKWPIMQIVTTWAVALLLSGVFILLFASANPVIAEWLALVDPRTGHFDIGRVLFWGFFLSIAWPFVAPRWRTPARRNAQDARGETGIPLASTDDLIGPSAILRSLVLFNLLFAVETILDLTYLWGGAALPNGMTYATYAHSGAYPLVVTALLAAGFILLATQREETRRSRPIRLLIYLWTAQNVLLTISSVMRLRLYIETYSLTHLRVAAFIWMGLVTIGLVLIVARMVLERSNRWLLTANLAVLSAVLYGCCFVNFPSLIGRYNVMHSREISHQGTSLDVSYLIDLGPQALPAIDCFNALSGWKNPTLSNYRDQFASRLASELASWRSWSFRSWRLMHTLPEPPAGTSGETATDASHSCR